MRDEGAVSELLGYSILTGVVIIAALSISTGAGDLISSYARSAGLEEATGSVGALSGVAARSIASANSYPETVEMVIPPGYELLLLDGEDDWHRLTVSVDGSELASPRPGSLSLQSAFRSVTCEGGGVFVNDSGSCRPDRAPSIFISGEPSGKTSLFICVPCLKAEDAVWPAGREAILSLSCGASRDYHWDVSPGARTSVRVRTGSQEGWKEALEDQGFTVTVAGDTVTGSRGGIDEIDLAAVDLQVSLR